MIKPNVSGLLTTAMAVVIVIGSVCELAKPRHLFAEPLPSCGRRCGVERWQIKTLSDPERGRVNLSPVQTTIEALIALERPRHTPQYARVWPTEFTTYQIDGYLAGYRPESDRDLHVIVAGLENQRALMVVEIPDPRCSGACASGLSAEFAKARETVYQILAQPNPTDKPIIVRVTGVGFFDRNHGQVGAAPNIIELHPVLRLELVSSDSSEAVAPPPKGH